MPASSADEAGNGPFGHAATGANPTDCGKRGVKRSLLTDGAGIRLAVLVDGANRHDVKLLCATLDGLVIARPEPKEDQPQHLCLKGSRSNNLTFLVRRNTQSAEQKSVSLVTLFEQCP